MVNFLLRRAALMLITCAALLWAVTVAPVHAQIDPYGPGATTLRVRITQQGFSPSQIQVYGPVDVLWTNNSGETLVLRSGDPSEPGQTLYLPTVNVEEGAQIAQVTPRANAAVVDFVVTLPPGASFVQRYTLPGSYRFHTLGDTEANGQLEVSGTGFLTSSPLNGESGVAPTRETIVAFSGPLDPATVTQAAFAAEVAGQPLAYRIKLSEDKRRVTLFYDAPLPGNARVRISMDGAILRAVDGEPVDVDSDNQPGGLGVLEFNTLSLNLIPGTSVCGRVFASELASNGQMSVNTPLPGVTITVDGREAELRAMTDEKGNFCLDPAPAGRFFVHIDGRTATTGVPAQSYYPFVGKAWESVAGDASNIGDIYLPLVAPGTLQPVSQTEDTVIGFAPSVLAKFPQFAKVQITVPAGSLYNDDGTPGGQVGIAPVPPDRIPGQLPEELEFPLVITVQTDGATNFDVPAPICFPNLPNPNTGVVLLPGEKSALWSFNHDTGRFAVVGPMTASADGELVCTDPGVGVPAPGWHSWSPGTPGGGGPLPLDPPEDPPICEESASGARASAEVCQPRDFYTPEVNGCGPENLIEVTGDLEIYNNPIKGNNDLLNITDVEGCDFRPACNTHDIGYSICTRPQAATDTQFYGDLIAACGACYPPDDPVNGAAFLVCANYARSYYAAVSNFGDVPYAAAQKEGCNCLCTIDDASGAVFRTHETGVFAEQSQAQESELSTGEHFYAVVNLENKLAQRGMAGSNGIAFENDLILAPNTRYSIFILEAATLREGTVTIITPSPGESFSIPPIVMLPMQGYDIDFDGLGAYGEFILQTDGGNPDSDGDGVLDGAEVQQGTNPLDDVQVQTGIIGTAGTPGTALDVCLWDDLAAVADGDSGLAVFNVFGGMNPLILAQIGTPFAATAVACDRDFIAAATGSAGVSIVEVAALAQSEVARQVAFDGIEAVAVTVADGIAYVGLGNGKVARVNLATGEVLGQLPIAAGTTVQDVALQGDYLYAITLDALYAIALDTFTVSGSLPFSGDNSNQGKRLRLAPDTLRAIVTDEWGYKLFALSLPSMPSPIATDSSGGIGWRQVIPTGAGLGVAVIEENGPNSADVSLYDIRGADVPGPFLVRFPTPGDAAAVVVHQGLAYVADGESGLQVLSYISADTQGITPTIALESNFAPERAEAGKPMRLTALTSDDVQVREVEFYIDDELMMRDGSYPFEYRFTTPNEAFTVRARAIDSGGNATWTTVQTRTIVADAAAPRVTAVTPLPDTGAAPTTPIRVTFNEAMNGSTFTSDSFLLFGAGTDQVLGTQDDVAVDSGTVAYDAGTRTASLSFEASPPAGSYRAVVLAAASDAAGNGLPHDHSWDFQLVSGATVVKLLPDLRQAEASFGSTVAVDGDLMAVGSPFYDVEGVTSRGVVYLFRRDSASSTGWTQFKQLIAIDGEEFDRFGEQLALHGDTLIVAAPRKDIGAEASQGQVYVFMRDAGGPDNWGEVTRFADSPGSFDYFGEALAIHGNTFVVGAAEVNAAYVYTRTAAAAIDWTLAKMLVPGENEFGSSVSIRDDEQRIVVGADDALLTFDRDADGPDNWGMVGRMTASDVSSGGGDFGYSVAIHDDLLVVGARFRAVTPPLGAEGAIYIFAADETQPTAWREIAFLEEADTAVRRRYLGSSVATDGVRVAAGGPGYTADADREFEIGTIYVFRPTSAASETWIRETQLVLSGEMQNIYAGHWVVLDGDVVISGAPLADGQRGAVYIFTLPPAP